MPNDTPPGTPPGLIGRRSEQRTLSDVAANLLEGQGALILIGGEAGIGKTALVEDFLPHVHALGARIFSGACYDVGMSTPYTPWTEAFQSPDSMDAHNQTASAWLNLHDQDVTQDQASLFERLRQRLLHAATRQPLVVVLEDLHWADRESLELLRYICRTVARVPILIIGTYRDDETDTSHPLHFVLPQLVREARATRLDLRRFTPDLVRQLVGQRYELEPDDRDRLVQFLTRRTDGNLFYLIELLRSLEMANVLTVRGTKWWLGSLAEVKVPMLVRQVVDYRVLRLDQATREALQVAAILGQEVNPGHWRQCAGLDEPEFGRIVSRALEAHVLESSSGGAALRFRHALFRESIYDSIPLPERQMQHRRIATCLAETGHVDPAIIGTHFRQASDERAAGWLLQAAREARRMYAPHLVIQYTSGALDTAQPHSKQERMEAYRLRGWAEEIVGSIDAANHDLLRALDIARETAAGESEWECLIRLAETWAGINYERAGEYVRQALARAEDMGDDTLRAHSLNRLGNWHLNAERPSEARHHHHQALEIFQTTEDQSGIAVTCDLLGLACYMGGDLIEGTGFYQRSVHMFRSLENPQGLSSSLANLSMRGVTYQTDTMVPAHTTLEECTENGRQALSIAREIGWRAGEAYARLGLISCYGSQGMYQPAIDAANAGIAQAEEIGHRQWLTAACCNTGMLYLDLLDPDTALRHLQRARAIAEDTWSSNWIVCASGMLALACLLAGADDDAESELRTTSATGVRPAVTLARRLVWRARAELKLHRGNAEEAINLVDRLIAATPHASLERPPVRLAVLRGRGLILAGRFEEAEQWLRAAHTVARKQSARSVLWRIHRDLGISASRQGKRRSAADEFAKARRLIDEISGTIHDSDERNRFRQTALGQLPESWSPTPLQADSQSYGGLTRRQREVAALVATGSSNREIAEHLSISERTVESHAASILATLGLSTRVQVAAWAVEHGLVEHSR